MSSRERFEAWHSRNYDTLPGTELHRVERAGMLKAWRVRDAEVEAARKDIETLYHIISEKDAEVARLVEALRYAVSIIGHPDDAGTKMLRALLAKYEEKRDE